MQTRMDIEKILQDGKSICIKPQGYSMYPVFVPGRDEAVIEPVEVEKLKRGDVVLYRRGKEWGAEILVMHRIWKVKAEGIYLVGDNQKEIEGPLSSEQIRGIMTGMNRKGKYISAKNPWYCFCTTIWLWLRPLRPAISKTIAFVKRLLKKYK